MSSRPTIHQKILVTMLVLSLGSFPLLVTGSTAAKTVAGELLFARQVTLNGTAAISGLTVFSESRFQTSPSGAATINLNQLGRIGLGPETEMTLRFTESMMGGSLLSGRVIVSAPAGVKILVVTAQGLTQSDGKQATALTIDVTDGHTRVVANLGDAEVTSGHRIEYVAEGKEVVVGTKAANKSARTKNPTPAGSGTGSTQASGGSGGGILFPLVVAAASFTAAAVVATTLNRPTKPVSASVP